MRALEFQRPMMRATNTGATAVIDHRGPSRRALPPFTAGVLEARCEGRRRHAHAVRRGGRRASGLCAAAALASAPLRAWRGGPSRVAERRPA